MASVVWSITDPSLLTQLKNAEAGQRFQSPAFEAFGQAWYLSLFPNGANSDIPGYLHIFLNAAALSPKIKSMRVIRTQNFLEAGVSHEGTYTLSSKSMSARSWDTKKVKTEDALPYDQWTFSVAFNFTDLVDQTDNDIPLLLTRFVAQVVYIFLYFHGHTHTCDTYIMDRWLSLATSATSSTWPRLPGTSPTTPC